jgi:hypothetical protein
MARNGENMDKYVEGMLVCVSVKSLYDRENGVTFGTIVPDYEEGKLAYYDLYNEYGELSCCDGEELAIDQVGADLITLRNDNNTVDGTTVFLTLTREEAAVAINMEVKEKKTQF